MKILYVYSKRANALQYFRQYMPMILMRRIYPEIESASVSTHDEGMPDVITMKPEELNEFQIVSYLRQITYDMDYNRKTIDFLHYHDKKIIFDIDDWWRVPRNHISFDAYKKTNLTAITEDVLSRVDAVTTTTEYLAVKIYPFNKNVYILPNAIDPEEVQFKQRKIESSFIRFGWAGGVHHLPDIEIMRDSLKKAHFLPNIQLFIGGFNTGSDIYIEMEKIFTDNYRFLRDDKNYLEYLSKFTPVMEHISFDKPYRRLWGRDIYTYADIYNNFDVVLAPLEDNNFNHRKSELKLIEAGTMGKAVIASAIPPYSDIIEHGVDGFLVSPFRNHIDWFIFMKRYVENPQLIKEHAANLSKKIAEKFDIYKINEKRKQIYFDILK